ncbi:HigA family addiction module antidote protein [Patescibacteria group bacterium]|nr:HigA family addiction module antidote protein [Patescibacteria group bacterium]
MGTTGYTSPIAVHPGETVRETLEVLGIAQTDLSLSTGLAEKTISEILNGKNPITPETALKFERVLGISKLGLLNMQAQYDADLLRLKEEKRLVVESKNLERFSCYSELEKIGYVKKTRNPIEKVEELLKFFAVDSLSAIQQVMPVAFRISHVEKINHESLAAWLKIGHIEANKMETNEFNLEELRNKLDEMRSLTIQDAEEFSKRLVELCAACGIALVFTPYLKNTNVNGATRWLTPRRALIQLSLRYKYADSFWFTFFHEIGHLIKHSKKEVFVDFKNGHDNSALEKEVDQFAQKMLIPSTAAFEALKKSLAPNNLELKIQMFAKENNIDPGIVAGRLARETGKWNIFERFRKKLCFKAS